ncbi:MAG: hypothetical protein E6Q60_12110 [Nitrosomonas oligotropha]|uniref:Uncharacterized protein n=1 Tax=Nitrosomonas oligotropha TaxID=42354 RepID=A0A5C7VN68_9PROT|nr:MAG: hypothetical protein E6Q60_12110 [Nitrosomonas oligotropha]
MIKSASTTDKDQLKNVGHYAAAFIDLLGQREKFQGMNLLPIAETEEEKEKVFKIIKETIGPIDKLQRRATEMMESSNPNPDSKLRAMLPSSDQTKWDEMIRATITTQRWSDGLFLFTSLAEDLVKCPLNAIFRMFGLTGVLCFMGLATKQPLRGAIEVAWGVELQPGELYGPVVARAYELESEVAAYPRIVIGPYLVNYLELQSKNASEEHHDMVNQQLASLCLKMLLRDTDGHWLLHYLGADFRIAVTGSIHGQLYSSAKSFVNSQLSEHQRKQNTKLAFRYAHLQQYFEIYSPDHE